MVIDTSREALLNEYGRFYGEQHFAVTFTSTTTGDDAKRVTLKEWDKTAPLADGGYGAGLVGQRGKTRNIAIVLRPSRLVVMECDSEEDLARLDALELPETVTVRSSQPYKRHYYFRPDPAMEMLPYVAFRFESGKVTADTGRYFLAPPSIHPSGAVYSFLPGHGPGEIEIATLPETVYRKIADQARTETADLRTAIETDPETKIRAGNRRDLIFRYACMLRRWGLSEREILEQCHHFNETRCDPPVDRLFVAVQVAGAMKKKGNQELATASFNGQPAIDDAELPAAPFALTARDFANLDEPDPEPLLGTPEMNILPQHGLAILAGKPGAGKTTIALDLAFSLASGRAWPSVDDHKLTSIACPRPLRVLLIENEGPPTMFRKKLRAKIAAWPHPFAGQIWVQTWRWGSFSFAQDEASRAARTFLDTNEIDIVIGDPLKSLGVTGVGAPNETRDFTLLLVALGLWKSRSFFFLHHFRKDPAEDDIDQLSGAWGGDLDTLMVLKPTSSTDQLRLSFPKLRWADGERKPMLLGKIRNLASFEYLGDEGDPRMLETQIVELLHDGQWRTAPEIGHKTTGIGARRDDVKACLESNKHLFRSLPGDTVGRSPKAICWQLVTVETPNLDHSSQITGRVGTTGSKGDTDDSSQTTPLPIGSGLGTSRSTALVPALFDDTEPDTDEPDPDDLAETGWPEQ